MKKPVLYIDIDGVLFGVYRGCPQLRPNAIGFLVWATQHFECRWATAWTEEKLTRLLKSLYAPYLMHDIKYVKWSHGEKEEIIEDIDENFYWIEDGAIRDRFVGLVDASGFSRYIEVSPRGQNELARIEWELKKRLHIEQAALGGFQDGFTIMEVPRCDCKWPEHLICGHGCAEVVQLVSNVSGEVEFELCTTSAREMGLFGTECSQCGTYHLASHVTKDRKLFCLKCIEAEKAEKKVGVLN